MKLVSIITVAAMAASPAVAESTNVSLSCRGRAETIEYGKTDLLTGQDDVVHLQINGQSGLAALPRLIGGKNYKSLTIKDVRSDNSEITGKIWYGRIGNAKMRINRIEGLISIRGAEGNFSGTCSPLKTDVVEKPLF